MCPKCKKNTLWPVDGYSRSSGLDRSNGNAAPTFISGLSCSNCGVWREGADAAAVTLLHPPSRPLERSGRMDTKAIVDSFYESIESQRKAKATYETIARLLTQSGHKCNDKTLQKFFLLEKTKRCCDESPTQ